MKKKVFKKRPNYSGVNLDILSKFEVKMSPKNPHEKARGARVSHHPRVNLAGQMNDIIL